MINIKDTNTAPLYIGKEGENCFRAITVDIGAWLAQYENCQVTAMFQRPDGAVYQVPLEKKSNVVIWKPTANDTYPGLGKLELRIQKDEMLGKSCSITTVCDRGIGRPNALEALEKLPGGVEEGQVLTWTSAGLCWKTLDNIENVWQGKKASFYGDSLTEVNYHYTKGYHAWVKELLGLAAYDNYGKSGYTLSDIYHKACSTVDNPDIVFIMGGGNDQNFSTPLGVLGDTSENTIYGALEKLCAMLKGKYPTSILLFITPTWQTKYPSNVGVTSREVSKAMHEVCGKYAIPVYDNFRISGVYDENLSVYTTDNCHWNDTTHEMVGRNLAKYLKNTFCYVHGYTKGEVGSEPEVAVTLTGISATYTGGDVAAGTSVTALQGITVTASYSDGSKQIISGYTLSGTIEEGSNTITVTYNGLTATFTVTGVANSTGDEDEEKKNEFPLEIINNSLESAVYVDNTLTLNGLQQAFCGVVFKEATEAVLDLSRNVSNLISPDQGGFGWWMIHDESSWHVIGVRKSEGTAEHYELDETLTTYSGSTILDFSFPTTGTGNITLRVEGEMVNLYIDDVLSYSHTGDAIGYMTSNAKAHVLRGLEIV